MDDFSYSLLLKQLVALFKYRISCIYTCYFHNVIDYSVESPPRQYYFMSSLWIATYHTIKWFVGLITYLELLVVLGEAATV